MVTCSASTTPTGWQTITRCRRRGWDHGHRPRRLYEAPADDVDSYTVMHSLTQHPFCISEDDLAPELALPCVRGRLHGADVLQVGAKHRLAPPLLLGGAAAADHPRLPPPPHRVRQAKRAQLGWYTMKLQEVEENNHKLLKDVIKPRSTTQSLRSIATAEPHAPRDGDGGDAAPPTPGAGLATTRIGGRRHSVSAGSASSSQGARQSSSATRRTAPRPTAEPASDRSRPVNARAQSSRARGAWRRCDDDAGVASRLRGVGLDSSPTRRPVR